MGLFSGGFGSGLVEGLAESVDQSLRNAMDKREKELSAARQFWQTRQAQKMDLADEHDERAGDALDKLIKEFKGDTAKGLAAYQAIGGNVDDVENYLAQVQDTRNKLGAYDITEKLKLDGIDMTQFADLSRDAAFQSIRKDVSGLDIEMEDSGLLSKIGFGKDLGAEVSAGVNELIPARQFEDITEFAAATLDRSGLVGTEEYARQVARETLQGQDRYFYNIGRINSGELSVEEADQLRDENAAILLATELFEKAKDTSGGDFTTLTELTSQFKTWRIGEKQVDWVRNNLLDDEGQARSVDAQAMITGYDFRNVVKGIQSDIASTAEAEGEGETVTPETGDPLDAFGGEGEEILSEQEQLIKNMNDPIWVLENPQPTIDEMFRQRIAAGDNPRDIANKIFENMRNIGQFEPDDPELKAIYDMIAAKLAEVEEQKAAAPTFDSFGKDENDVEEKQTGPDFVTGAEDRRFG